MHHGIMAMYHGYVSWLCIMAMYHGYYPTKLFAQRSGGFKKSVTLRTNWSKIGFPNWFYQLVKIGKRLVKNWYLKHDFEHIGKKLVPKPCPETQYQKKCFPNRCAKR